MIRNVLVTGGTGFIGQHVVDELEQRGYQPTIFDHHRVLNAHTWTSVQAWKIGMGSTFLGDIRDPVAVTEAIAKHDAVIHLAGVLGTQETIRNPTPAVETNVLGGLNIFKACHQYQRKCVYIAVGNHWMNNSYSITKTTAERFALMFNRELGTDISVVRGLNAYGPGQKAEPVRKIMPNFILPALRDEAITVYGDGSQIMDMIYVSDLAAILVNAMETPFNPHNPVIEAGTGRRTTVLEIAEEVVRQVGSGRIEHVPMRPGEPENSIVLAHPDMIPWPVEFVSLEDGISRTVEYYRPHVKLAA